MPIARGELLKQKRGAVVGRRELKEKMRSAPPTAASSTSSSSHDTTATPFYDDYQNAGIAAREIAFLQHVALTKRPRNCRYRKHEQAQKKARKYSAVSEAQASRDFYDSGDFDAVPGDMAASMEKWLTEEMRDLHLTEPDPNYLSWEGEAPEYSEGVKDWLRDLREVLQVIHHCHRLSWREVEKFPIEGCL